MTTPESRPPMNDSSNSRDTWNHALKAPVTWPNMCARCGATPPEKNRSFQVEWAFDDYHGFPKVMYEMIELPLCSSCDQVFRGFKGMLSRIFPIGHRLVTIVHGQPQFSNPDFQRQFKSLNPAIYEGSRIV